MSDDLEKHDLRELIKEWRDEAAAIDEDDSYSQGYCFAMAEAADELEDLVEGDNKPDREGNADK